MDYIRWKAFSEILFPGYIIIIVPSGISDKLSSAVIEIAKDMHGRYSVNIFIVIAEVWLFNTHNLLNGNVKNIGKSCVPVVYVFRDGNNNSIYAVLLSLEEKVSHLDGFVGVYPVG